MNYNVSKLLTLTLFVTSVSLFGSSHQGEKSTFQAVRERLSNVPGNLWNGTYKGTLKKGALVICNKDEEYITVEAKNKYKSIQKIDSNENNGKFIHDNYTETKFTLGKTVIINEKNNLKKNDQTIADRPIYAVKNDTAFTSKSLVNTDRVVAVGLAALGIYFREPIYNGFKWMGGKLVGLFSRSNSEDSE